MQPILKVVQQHLESGAKEHEKDVRDQNTFMLGSCEVLLACLLHDVSRTDKPLYDQWMRYLSGGSKYE
jgi:hypothetical protein